MPTSFYNILILTIAMISLAGTVVAQGADTPTGIQVLTPQNNDTVEGEFIISANAFDRRGEGSGIEHVDVYAGSECSGESLVQRVGIRRAPRTFVQAFELDDPLVQFRILAQANQSGNFMYTICFTSSYTHEVIGKVTQTVNVPDLSYRRQRLRIVEPAQNEVLTAPFWVIGQTFDTAGGDELAPGIEIVKLYEGNDCSGEVIAESEAVSNSAAFARSWMLSGAYNNSRFDLLVPIEAVEGNTGAFTFTVCSYSAYDGTVAGTQTLSVMLTNLQETQYDWELLAGGFEQPVDIEFSPDGRMFVVQKSGEIYLAQEGQRGNEPILDISDLLTDYATVANTDSGLLSMALDPDFATNHFIYVYYANSNFDGTLARYTLDESGQAELASRQVIFTVPFESDNHVGGQMLFGPDGYLYVGIGDNNFTDRVQDLSYPYGSILRLDVGTLPYQIPEDNPFVNVEGAMGEIYFYGLRNPWRFSFDAANNDWWIADVGDRRWEEINRVPAEASGLNFGWPLFEGNAFNGQQDLDVSLDDLAMPIYVYPHADDYCSVIGGHVYRGSKLPELEGQYIFADYCSGTVEHLLPAEDGGWSNDVILNTPHLLVSFTIDPAGELVYADIASGSIYRIVKKD